MALWQEELLCGKPWIFKQIIDFITLERYDKDYPDNDEKLKIILEHLTLEINEKGEDVAIKEMRKHLACYIKNGKDASKIREKINNINNKEELINCLKEYFK